MTDVSLRYLAFRWCLLLAALGTLPLLSACSNERLFKWQEEVALSTGETLLLERATHFRKSGEAFNPLESSWGREDSSIVVKQGPSDLVGARFTLKDWFDPVVLDRDPQSRQLTLIATAWNCDWIAPYKGKNRSVYVGFAMRAGAEAEAVDFPDWAWSRQRNLYKPFVHIDPPKHVTPAETKEHNATKAEGSKRFFVVDPTFVATDCPGETK